jgi:diguanylate cyclase (GGDEF)-like protein/PAS domain S-box-containing protein
VIAAVFFGFRQKIKNRIQETKLQVLTEAAEQKKETVLLYFNTVFSKLDIMVRCETATAAIAGMADGEGILWIAITDAQGRGVSNEGAQVDVSGCDWFAPCMEGERTAAVAALGGYGENAIVTAIPLAAEAVPEGIIMAAIDPDDISVLAEANIFGGQTRSLLMDSAGNIFAAAGKTAQGSVGQNLFDAATDLQTENARERGVLSGETEVLSLLHGEQLFYAAVVPLGISDWFLVLETPSAVFVPLSRDMLTYVIVMLALVALAHLFAVAQAYRHEKKAVKALERDKELLRQSGERYALINRLSNEVLFTVDMESGNILFNDSFESMFGFLPPQCSINRIEECYVMIDPEDRSAFLRFIEHMIAGAPQAHQDLRMIDARGVSRWKRLEIYTVFDKQGHARQVVGKITDIHRQKKSMQRLRQKADSDPLTGLLNRAALEQSVKTFLAGDGKDGRHAFLMLDIDNFKRVNDTLGHAEGDRMLIDFASAVKVLFRTGDLMARMGGDEFAILMKDIESEQNALIKADGMRGTMLKIAGRFGVAVSVSVGISIYAQDGHTFGRLYQAADAALYRVKNEGKNCSELFRRVYDGVQETNEETEEQDNGTDKG